MTKCKSKKLNDLISALRNIDGREVDEFWLSVDSPLIDESLDNDKCLVTFIYRHPQDSNNIDVYLYSTITGFAFSKESKFINIPEAYLSYLTIETPKELRTNYSFLLVDDEAKDAFLHIEEAPSNEYPKPIGEFRESLDKLNILFQQNKVIIDLLNAQEITYYKDYENPIEYFAKESILELMDAPRSPFTPLSFEVIKIKKKNLQDDGRLLTREISFAETSLSNQPGYFESPSQQKRKYWVYLPKSYESNQKYPLLLFLDGSSYLNNISIPYVLDKLEKQSLIAPSIAVFLEYSIDHRITEYDCNDEFVNFLIQDFIPCLKQEFSSITNESSLVSIIGLSASGLSAFYAGLKHPLTFGNVIAQSPSLEMKSRTEISSLIESSKEAISSSRFIFNMGSFETTPIPLQLKEGSTQALSSYDASRYFYEQLRQEDITVEWHEFIGGHNEICWREILPYMLQLVLRPGSKNIQTQENDTTSYKRKN